jgi:hypothetical protein
MAKHTVGGGERSKVKIFFVEADLADGDMEQLTQALMTAIRPSPGGPRAATVHRIAAASAPLEEIDEAEVEEMGDVGENPDPSETRRSTSAKRTERSYRSPEPVEMDMNGDGTSFQDFVARKQPQTSTRGRYLLAVVWLKEHAGLATVTADHVLTCYKSAGWTYKVEDSTLPFRALKKDKLGKVDKGSFSVNHLGVAAVADLPDA